MIEQINKLEAVARQLEPGAAVRKQWQARVIAYSESFLKSIYDIPTYIMTEDKGAGLLEAPISEESIDMDAALGLLKQNVDRPGLNPASGGHLAYIPGGGIYTSALADYLADVFNRYSGVFFAGPGAVRMENMLLNWMAGLVGYPETAAGNLTSGGSVANLIGIVTARETHSLKAKDIARSVIYLSEQVHHSVHKALRIAGLKECPRRTIALDEKYRMRSDVLADAIAKDKQSGLNPWLVIASAGTTDTGAVDPLQDIGQIALSHGLWFHLDGAYGAFFILCDEGKKILKGMDSSDSIVMDPHKGLFLPYGSGAVLVKDGQKLLDAHYYMPNYLQDTVNSRDELSPADLSPELTKHFRGLRLWLPLKLHGLRPFRAALEEKICLARYFYDKLQNTAGFELGPFPDLSVVTFRYLPEQGNANEFNQRLVQEIQKDGRVFLSSTMLGDTFVIRLAVLAFRTHLQIIERTLDILQEKVDWLTSR